MSNMNAPAASAAIASALLISDNVATIEQLRASMEHYAMSQEVCAEVPAALALLNQRKFEAVIVDLHLAGQANAVLEKVRRSPSNRTAVIFTVSENDAETSSAFKAGSNFVLRKPLSPTSVDRGFRVAYGLILRERRRYFRCPVKIPVAIHIPGMPEAHGQTLNISENGIAIATSVSVLPGVKVQVHFALPGDELRFVVEATICWSKESYLGLQFCSVSPRLSAVLQEWLLQKLEESFPQSLADKFRNLQS
ncbi:MAG: PilZ domain-containing protein [Terriglobales bacterium]|jgi:CheY-like chemotaxis protein